ncbi:uncharacterized protein LOC112590453 [Harpegnathos saltator]|uniref:uncharacterized protein LOC112590453 n=1 Tax=Harpegnathos saltator TaxID=610380 RepID=UPI000DBEE2D8|nr:uncharacterized protein LOC112590453 [Harpegnathos saltator]
MENSGGLTQNSGGSPINNDEIKTTEEGITDNNINNFKIPTLNPNPQVRIEIDSLKSRTAYVNNVRNENEHVTTVSSDEDNETDNVELSSTEINMSGKEKQHYPDDVLELKKLLEEASQRREKAIQKEQDLRKRKEEVVKQQLRNAIEKTIREAEQIEKQNKKMKKQIRQANSDDSIDIVEVDEQSPTHFDPNQPSTSGVSKKDKPISRYSYERGFSERMQRPYINLNTIPRPRNKRGQYRPWTQGHPTAKKKMTTHNTDL